MPLNVDSLNSGTIKTESLTVAGESVGPKYKVYTALLSQTGTNPPVATVLENTLDADITYQYSAPGSYAIVTPNNTFIPNKTYIYNILIINESFYYILSITY